MLDSVKHEGRGCGLGVLWLLSEFLLTGDEPATFGQVQEESGPWYQIFDWGPADLFILPFIRTVIDIPERIINWWKTVFESLQWLISKVGIIDYVSETGQGPWRWAVVGEMLMLGILVLVGRTIYRRRVANAAVATDADTDQLVSA